MQTQWQTLIVGGSRGGRKELILSMTHDDNPGRAGRDTDKATEESREASYTDLSTVESQRNDLTFEEFPEGPYGADLHEDEPVKSSPWRPEQRQPNRFGYENRELHGSQERDYPGDDRSGAGSQAVPGAIKRR